MKEEEIFGSEPYETFVSFEDCRFQFALARRCRLYRYDKLVGINFSVFFDHLDEDAIRNLPYVSVSEGCYDEEDIYLDVSVKGLNHTNNRFEDLGNFQFSAKSKDWVTQELRVRSDFIGDESDFTIKFTYAICRSEAYTAGFLRKRRDVYFYSKTDPNAYKLETQLVEKGGAKEAPDSSEDPDDALDDLLARKGIR